MIDRYEKKIEVIFWILIFVVVIVLSLFIYDAIKISNLTKAFCEDQGYKHLGGEYCYKIEKDTIIEKKAGIHDDKIYWVGK